MTTQPLRSVTPAIDTYIKLAQFPILADEIRARMREEIFRRGIISQPKFENEVKKKASESLRREGLFDPFGEEPTTQWQLRKERIRAFQTDAYFSNNLGSQLLDRIIEEVLSNKNAEVNSLRLGFNPEVAPWDLLFRQGEIYENLPPLEQEKVAHHLKEIKVVLIKRLISDQLPFIAVAKQVFNIGDLRSIYKRRIGRGKIGGKAAGMTLAWKILQQQNPEFGPDISGQVDIPDSWFIGTEVIYDYRLANDMDHYMNQKYRPLEEIRTEYPEIVQAHLEGDFPEEIVEQIREVMEQVGDSPLIVR
ncbi:MAG: PEP/pyruvate-binding domain-containing protein, partial [Anaerolineae bacterium]